ncbi:Bug family tripartite tricarboxylate transporter substrate binding protein [Ottowia thiooxydans]|uniref:Tripartite-type tricarboxylate transporter receptor subunit TctC n=1 Tax=Ottowia thiooxydans TaxID=219182 RepID=A0ABV2QDV8_9BURK
MNSISKWLLAAVLATPFGAVIAQDKPYPDRPVRIIVPYPPGGAPDLLARMLSTFVKEGRNWNVVVDNKPGAGGNLALDLAAKARPDGYTLVIGQTDNVALNPLVYSKLSYDPDRDLEPVGLIAKGTLVLVVRASSPFKTLGEVIEVARTQPGKISFATPGYGTSAHILHEIWERASNIKLAHIPYKGSAFALPDLLGGQIDLYIGSIPTLKGQIESGVIRALAVTGTERAASLRNVPTFAEAGVTGVDMASAFGLLLPRGTPADITLKWNTAINEMLKSPEARGKIVGMGADPLGGSSQEMRELFARDRTRYEKVIRAANIKLD